MSQGSDSNQNYYSFINNNTTPLVFVHGVGLDHQMWEPQTSSLKEYSIITYDLLGHGKTPFNEEEITLDDFSKQLLSVLDFLIYLETWMQSPAQLMIQEKNQQDYIYQLLKNLKLTIVVWKNHLK